ncbi:hypothetical protein OSB04_002638 [Centaurea solstitialis]|uniref:Uncharacterized protein n=1 Tax=Centaurea solstitialis TaxID=347529 RepID=A0AA38WMI9_9ASTR|nr:hypothetical protein OSB04_002638 [Centaurea solstitialis]
MKDLTRRSPLSVLGTMEPTDAFIQNARKKFTVVILVVRNLHYGIEVPVQPQCFAVKFHVKNVGLTGLTKTASSHVNLTLGKIGLGIVDGLGKV